MFSTTLMTDNQAVVIKKKKTFNNINTEILNMKSNTEKTFNKL